MQIALLLAAVPLAAQDFDSNLFLSSSLPRATDGQAVDVNGDGRLDLAVSTRDGVVWFKNEGAGPIGLPRDAGPRLYSSDITAMVWIDDDGDGDLDLIRSAESLLVPALARIENLGAGQFAVPQPLNTASTVAARLVAADIDNDGDQDLLVRDAVAGFVWFEKIGPGSYAPSQQMPNSPSTSLPFVLLDVDSDGNIDLVGSTGMGRIRLFLGDGAGGFAAGVQIASVPERVTQFTPTDVDQDGDIDLILSSDSLDSIYWLEQTGTSYAVSQVLLAGVDDVAGLDLADINGDGMEDLVCARFEEDSIAWFPALGGGSFGSQRTLLSNYGPMHRVIARDFDGDGDPDVVGTFFPDFDSTLSLLAFARNDGSGQEEDVFEITVSSASVKGSALADIDGDGDQDYVGASDFRSNVRWVENQGDGSPGWQRRLLTGVRGAVLLDSVDVPAGSPPVLILGDGSFDGSFARLRRLRFSATGGFTSSTYFNEMSDSGASFTFGDVNGDGVQDVLATYKPFLQPYELRWYLGPLLTPGGVRGLSTVVLGHLTLIDVDSDGDDDAVFRTLNGLQWIESIAGQFNGPVNPLGLTGAGELVVDSFDGDGLDDIVIGTLFYENLGGGSFAPALDLLPGGNGDILLRGADWDADGDTDLLFRDFNQPLSVIENLGGNAFAAPFAVPSAVLGVPGLEVLDIDGDQDVDLVSGFNLQRGLRYFGSGICGPANPMPNGLPGVLFAEGSQAVQDNDITLGAANLPVSAFGYFLTSMEPGFVPFAGGSQGNLCLSGSIGRYNRSPQEILQANSAGMVQLMIDLTDIPSPLGSVSAQQGDTRYFQYWTRVVSGGVPTSNFTNALKIELR